MNKAAFAASAPVCVQSGRVALCGHGKRPLVAPVRTARAARVAKVSMVSGEIVRNAIAVYGVFVAGGGIGAFLKSGSKMSALSGAAAGAVLAAAYVQKSVPLALGVALTLVVVFAARLAATKKFMPAGMLAAVSIAAAAFFAYAIYA